MNDDTYEPGQWIGHPDTDIGIGKIIEVTEDYVRARFDWRRIYEFDSNADLQIVDRPVDPTDPEFERRRSWFDIHERGDFTCPCCGYPTLTQPDSYHTCFLCEWIDDGTDDQELDEPVYTWPDQTLTLAEARSNFARYGHAHDPDHERAEVFKSDPRKTIIRETTRREWDEVLEADDPSRPPGAERRAKEKARVFIALIGD